MSKEYNWTDNPTEAQVASYNPDILNECLMHLKYNNLPSKNTICCANSGNVDIYGNADLIESQLSTNLVFASAGSYMVNIPVSGNYEVTLVGAGAGGVWGFDVYGVRHSASGGSGAGFIGNIYIPAGMYNCVVGAGGTAAGNGGYGGAGGDTYITGLISAGGGKAGAYATWSQHKGSAGGTMSITATVNGVSLNTSGNPGTGAVNASSAGGASVLNGYGKGGDGKIYGAEAGASGFLSLKFSGHSYINYKIGGTYPALIMTDIQGNQYAINGLNSDDASYLANGTYIKYVGIDGSSELVNNRFFHQAQSPNANVGDVWLNTSLEPLNLLKWNGSQWQSYNKIPIGKITVSNGTILSFETFQYNQNGYNINYKSTFGKPSGKYLEYPLGASSTKYTANYTGWFSFASLGSKSMQIYNNSRETFMAGEYSTVANAQCVYIPCVAGDEIQVYYSDLTNQRWLRNYIDIGQD